MLTIENMAWVSFLIRVVCLNFFVVVKRDKVGMAPIDDTLEVSSYGLACDF